MTEEQNAVKSGFSVKREFDLKDAFALGSIVGLGGCCINLYWYWSNFQINIFEYLTFAEIVGLALPQIAFSVLWALIIMMSVLLWILKGDEKLFEDSKNNIFDPDKEIRETRKGFLFAFLLVLLLLPLLYYKNYPFFYASTMGCGCLFVAGFLTYALVKMQVIKSPKKDSIFGAFLICSFLCFYVTYVATDGNARAWKVLRNEEYTWISTTQLKNHKQFQKKQKLKLVGHAGERWFFVTLDNAIKIIVKEDQIELLKFNKVYKSKSLPWPFHRIRPR